MRHKPLAEQVIVITGASSGIGLTTARMAARRGARVVLAARSREVLAEIVAELGPRAVHVVADVGRLEDVQAIADEARAIHYGDAEGRPIYGEASPQEARALVEEGIEVMPLPPAPDDRH